MLFLSFALGGIISLGITSGGQGESTLILLLLFPLLSFLFWGKKALLFILLGISGMVFGGYIGLETHQKQVEERKYFSTITKQGREKVWIEGSIEKVLYRSDFNTTYRLKIDKVDTVSTQIQQSNPHMLVQIPNNLTIHLNDTISFTGKVVPIFQSTTIDGFGRYAWGQGVYGSIFLPIFDHISGAPLSPPEMVRTWSIGVFFRGFPQDIAAILGGMVLGDTSLLSDQSKDVFLLSGLSHILVVSGANIAFVIILMTGVLQYVPMPSRIKIGVVVVFVLLYVSLVGLEISVLRATMMGVLSFLAVKQGKKIASITLLIFIGFVFLIYNPLLLRYDAGFGLSFGATLGILLFYEKIHIFLESIHIPKWIVSVFGVTFSATIGSFPVLVYHFGEISVGSLFANLLIAFVLGWIMMTSVMYLFLAVFGGLILYVFGFLVYIPVKFILVVSHFFSLGGSITIPGLWQNILPLVFFGYFLGEIFFEEIKRLTINQRVSHSHQ